MVELGRKFAFSCFICHFSSCQSFECGLEIGFELGLFFGAFKVKNSS